MPALIPYGRQIIDQDDIDAAVSVLRSDILTGGNIVPAFEKTVAKFAGTKYGVAVNSGTAALHAAINALNIRPGDEVIVPAITFAASANCILYAGGKPVFCDVDPDTLLININKIEKLITRNTRAIIGVDYAGQPCDWDVINQIAEKHGLATIADSCHALGAEYKDKICGSLANISVFSFHPVKHITTGEGGMAVTDNPDYAAKMRAFRNHGINSTAKIREESNQWQYDMEFLGYNYRLTDFQAALGISQLKKLPEWLKKRREIAKIYNEAFQGSQINPLTQNPESLSAWHLYVARIPNRDETFKKMREAGIGVNVHYKPVYLHSYYQKLGYEPGICPEAENAYQQILTLPLWPGIAGKAQKAVIKNIKNFAK